jgi:hypothetical protein
VRDRAGAPIPAAIVHVDDLESPEKHTLSADAKGCYKQGGIFDGFYEVWAEANGVVIERRQITLSKAGQVTVDLRFKPAPPESPAPKGPAMLNLQMLANEEKAARPPKMSTPQSEMTALESFTFGQETVGAGDPLMATIRLKKPAPAEGLTVKFVASNSLVATIPEEVTVPAGQSSLAVPVSTVRLRGPSNVNLIVKASDGVGSRSAELLIRSHTRLSVVIEGTGEGQIVSMPPGIRCEKGICTTAFPEDQAVQLMATAKDGHVFGGWSGDCNGSGRVVISGPMRCSATFSKP